MWGFLKEELFMVPLSIFQQCLTFIHVLFLFARKDEASSSNRDLIPSKRNITRVQDVIDALIADYQQAYFLTGLYSIIMIHDSSLILHDPSIIHNQCHPRNRWFAHILLFILLTLCLGNFTRSLYAEDCYFADPTISFTGILLIYQTLFLVGGL